jgi:hypothetical protein
MRPTFNQIVVNELQIDLDEIYEQRKALAPGIENDAELTNAFEKVIMYYNTKINGYVPMIEYYGQCDLNFAPVEPYNSAPVEPYGGVSYEDIGDINWKNDISIMGTDDTK